jgi:TonB-linked SusC/RagA family outer membrane protein
MKIYAFNQGVLRLWLPPKLLLIMTSKLFQLRSHNTVKKLLLVMKLIIVLLTTCLMQVSAAGFAQKLNYSKKNVTLEEVFKQITLQTGYNVLYSPQNIEESKKIDVNFRDADLEQVLEDITKGQRFEYTIDNKNIILKPKEEPTFLERLADHWASIDISGTVVDEKGIPLPGATVKAKGAKSVITDIKGRFMLENVVEGAMVTISYTGYVTLELSAKQSMGAIAMKLSDNPLDQVQIIAYGTQTKRYSLGNVVSVKAEDIEKQPVQNPLLALQGRVTGLEITQANGLNGSGVKVRIQGQNSIRNGSDPLIIIDGMPYPSQTLTSTSVGAGLIGFSGDIGGLSSVSQRGGAGNTLNYINPSDIESIEVLKDADATAIYGSRAANGAILITTKKGKAGDTQLDFNLQQGWGHVRKFMDLLNTEQYLEMRREAFKNDGLPIPSIVTNPNNTDYDLNGHWDTNSYTDWQKELIGGTAQYQNAILTLSGGSNMANFRLSGTYSRMGTVFPGRGAGNPSANLNFSISSTSANQKFTAQFSGSFMSNVNRLAGGDFTSTAVNKAPNAPGLYNADGSLNWAPTAAGVSSVFNPMASTLNKYELKTTNMIYSLALGYKILPGLEVKTNVGYTYMQMNEFFGATFAATKPEDKITTDPSAFRTVQYSNSNINSWNLEPQLNYRLSIDEHHFDALLGGTLQQNNGNGYYLSGSGYPNDFSLENPAAAASIAVGTSVIPVYKYLGAFARLNYRFKERYLLNIATRRDGSTRFGPANRFHNFASIAWGWIFTEEKLLKENLPFLSFGKLRGSFGTTGSDQIPDYRYLSLVNLYSGASIAYQGTVGYEFGVPGNPYLEWEEKKSLQLGIDLGFFKERVLIRANYVLNRTSNQLLQYDVPSIVGTEAIESNFPATLQNKGIELELRTANLKTAALQWSTSINLSVLRNKLVEFPNLENSTYANLLILDKPFNILKRRQFVGVDPVTGLYQVVGKSGPTSKRAESIIDAILIDYNPKYYGGLQNSISYKKFNVDFSLSFAKKIAPRYVASTSLPGSFGSGNGNQMLSVLQRWQQAGDQAEQQRFTQARGSAFDAAFLWVNSDARYVDASFISLKNVSLSYQLPYEWTRKVGLKSARIYSHAQNVWTFTKYKGFDPEVPGGSSLPPLRVITLGLQASL